MKKLFMLIAMSAIVTSCAPSGEQSKSLDDLDAFLASVEKDNLNRRTDCQLCILDWFKFYNL